jgi:PTS system mannose-specific IIA component
MLVKLAKIRGSYGLAEAVQTAEAAGRKYICSGHDVQQAAILPNGIPRCAAG